MVLNLGQPVVASKSGGAAAQDLVGAAKVIQIRAEA